MGNSESGFENRNKLETVENSRENFRRELIWEDQCSPGVLNDKRIKVDKIHKTIEDYPYNCIAKMNMSFMVEDNGKIEAKRCLGTGFLTNCYYLMTAGHNIYNVKLKTFAHKVDLYFGANLADENPITLEGDLAEWFVFGDGFIEGDTTADENDIAWIDLEKYLSSQTLSQLPSSLSSRPEQTSFEINRFDNYPHSFLGQIMTICGYPGDKNLPGRYPCTPMDQGQWEVSCFMEDSVFFVNVLLDDDDRTINYKRMSYKGATWKGQSGSPVFFFQDGTARVAGVHVGGDETQRCNMATLIPKKFFEEKCFETQSAFRR